MLSMNLSSLRLVLVDYSQSVVLLRQSHRQMRQQVYSMYLDLQHSVEQDLNLVVVLYSQHLEQQKQSVLKKNLQVYSVYLQHPHLLVTLTDSAGMHHLLKVVYSLLVVELRKSPSTIMIVLLLYSHLQTMVLLPMLLQLTKITEALLIL